MPIKPRLRIKAEALRRKRLEALLSQEELSKKTRGQVKTHTIKGLESRQWLGVQPRNVRALAKALGCDPFDISEVVDADSESEVAS